MPSKALVALQFAALLAVALPWRTAQWNAWGWLVLGLAAVVGLWTLAHNRPGNFSVLPEPRAGAKLVTTGPYRYVRHPMYAAVLLFAAGFAFGWGGAAHWGALATLAVVLYAKAVREERLLGERFSEYADYARRTPRLLPFTAP